MQQRISPRSWAFRTGLPIALLALAAMPVLAQQSPVERGRYFIGFTQMPGPAEQSLVRAAGGEIRHTYTIVPAISAVLPQAAVAALQSNPRIAYIEPVLPVQAIAQTTPWGIPKIKADVVQTGGNTGADIRVCIIDSGIDTDHPDLAANYFGGRDYVNNDSTPEDQNGHGTHVAGTVAAVANTQGVVGVAPGVQLYIYKILDANGGGSFDDAIAALEACKGAGGQVTNNSYGSSGDPGTTVKNAFEATYAYGIVHIAAAGNSGSPSGRGNTIGYPARYSSVVAVAATDTSNQRPSWSSYGDELEVSAPGVSIYSTYPNDTYATLSGTSMASPHVAGVAALVVYACSGISPADLRQRLRSTAIDLGTAGWDKYFGDGLVQADLAVKDCGAPPADVKDLGVLSVSAPASVTQATGGTVTVGVQNAGTVSIVSGDGFAIRLTDSLDSGYVETVAVGELAVSGTKSLTFTQWKAKSTGTATLTAALVDTASLDKVSNNNTAWTTVQVNAAGSAQITLGVTGYKVKGRQAADLVWSGTTGTSSISIIRNGATIATVTDSGAYTDNIGAVGGGSYTYKVCDAGTSTCSNEVTIVF